MIQIGMNGFGKFYLTTSEVNTSEQIIMLVAIGAASVRTAHGL